MPEPGNPFFWRAYMDLRGSRNIGLGLGPIPLTEIIAYAEHCRITCPVQRTRLIRIIGAMDAVEREMHGNAKSAP